MSYLDVISLDEARIYLKVDEDQEETNSEITSMLKASFRYVERITNIIAYARDLEYFPINNCVRIYDYPINDTLEDSERKRNYTNVHSKDILTVNVGYTNAEDVPEDYKQTVLAILKAEFYAQDEDMSDFRDTLPAFAVEFLNTQKRFII